MSFLPHLTWRQRAAFAAAAIVFAAVGGSSIPKADALPLMQHKAQFTVTPGPCVTTNGLWTVTVDIAGTFLELNPQAVIDSPASALTLPVPTHYVFNVATQYDTYTVAVVVNWDDGFTQDLGRQTVTRPENCPTPTTTCPDCTVSTQVVPPPPETTPDTIPVTSPPETAPLPSTVATVPPSSALVSVPAGPTTTRYSGTTTPPLLPATGAGDYVPVLVAVGAFLVLVGLITIRRSA